MTTTITKTSYFPGFRLVSILSFLQTPNRCPWQPQESTTLFPYQVEDKDFFEIPTLAGMTVWLI